MDVFLEQSISDFLKEYPLMRIASSKNNFIDIRGKFEFIASPEITRDVISDSYEILISIPNTFPRGIPIVKELQNKIPNDNNHHVNPADNSLCLGSPFRILEKLRQSPNLLGFAKKCLIPYFYATSYCLRNENTYPFGELSHGDKGLYEDTKEMFNLDSDEQVQELIKLFGLKKRIANKKKCICGCNKRLGKCKLRFQIHSLREFCTCSTLTKIIAQSFDL